MFVKHRFGMSDQDITAEVNTVNNGLMNIWQDLILSNGKEIQYLINKRGNIHIRTKQEFKDIDGNVKKVLWSKWKFSKKHNEYQFDKNEPID